MRRSTRLLVSTTVLALALGAGFAPATTAQDPTCPLATVEEVTSIFSATGVIVSTGSPALCVFGGTPGVYLAIEQGRTLEQVTADYPDGEELTVAGLPARLSAGRTQLSVGLDGRLFSVYAYGAAEGVDLGPALVAIAELAIPRLPAGPAAEDIARLEALIPATINGQPVTRQSFGGDLLLGFMDQAAAPVIALNEALAAQGKSAADVLFVGAETESSEDPYSVVAVLVKGADASRLLEPLFHAFASSDGGTATFTPIDVGGRPATLIEGAADESLVTMAIGDVILAASVPEAEREAVFAAFQ